MTADAPTAPGPPAPARPRFGIVTPSYNQGAYLRETIESVLSQKGLGTEFDLDYAVIDGGSTDDSAAIIREYEDRLTFWCSEKDRGQSHAINKGFDYVTKDPAAIVAWLNSDDVYLPGALSKVAAYWREHAPDALIGRCRKVDATGKVFAETEFRDFSHTGLLDWQNNYFMQPGCFLSRKAWDEAGGMKEQLHYSMDVDLWLTVSRKRRFETLDAPVAEAKAHAQAKTTNSVTRAEWWTDVLFTLLEHGGEEPVRRLLVEQYARNLRLNAELHAVNALPLVGLGVRAVRKLVRYRLARDPAFRPPKVGPIEPLEADG